MTTRTAALRGEREARKLRLGVVRAITFGAPVFFLFLGLDLYVRATSYPDADLGRVIGWRTAGALALASSLLFLRREVSALSAMRFTAVVLTATLVTLGGLAVELGGLESSYIFTIAYFAVAIGTFLPANWRGMSLLIGLPTLAFLLTMVIGVAASHQRAQLEDPKTLHTFAAHTILMVGLVGFAVFSGQVHWRARRALDDARRLGRYRLKRLIGEGGMNEVWLARDESLGRDIALKILRPEDRPGAAELDTTRVRRFEREALATSALTSPHTVRVFDHGVTDEGVSWIAMEYLRGLDLDNLVTRHGPLEPRRALHFMRQAALSLAEAHELGVVHRDIKPANLFALSGEGEQDFLKVVDFGIARPLDPGATSLTMVGMLVGTPAFMAPELFLGRPADPRADVYALGATLYLLVTGQQPLEFAGMIDLLDFERRAGIRPPSTRLGGPLPEDVSSALDRLVMACLESDPSRRLADAKAVLAAIDAVPLSTWTDAEARHWWSIAQTADSVPAPEGIAPTLPTA
jgi:tRNA A-37 threonylcarbamoyl transferase component Bud32